MTSCTESGEFMLFRVVAPFTKRSPAGDEIRRDGGVMGPELNAIRRLSVCLFHKLKRLTPKQQLNPFCKDISLGRRCPTVDKALQVQ